MGEKTFEYEVKWQFKGIENNSWVEKDILVKMGYLKMVQREDEKQAAMAGLQSKQLTKPGVEKHLADFGVDAESASHTQLNQLSGGMKVKVVLAAAMWQNPHILILDEPTNYLDREGLGALVLAIKEYKGGVLIISHNKKIKDLEKKIKDQEETDAHRGGGLGAGGPADGAEGGPEGLRLRGRTGQLSWPSGQYFRRLQWRLILHAVALPTSCMRFF